MVLYWLGVSFVKERSGSPQLGAGFEPVVVPVLFEPYAYFLAQPFFFLFVRRLFYCLHLSWTRTLTASYGR